MRQLTYRERHKLALMLADAASIEADKKLLAQYNSKNELLHRTLTSAQGNTLAFDLVYFLLGVCTPGDIAANRTASQKTAEEKAAPRATYTTEQLPGWEEEKEEPAKKKPTKKTSTQKSTGKTSKTPASKKRS